MQKNLESGETPQGDGLDIKAYEQVFRALKKEPAYQLSSRFAETVVAKVILKEHGRDSKDYFWFGAGIFFLLMAFIGTVLFTGFRLDFGFLSVMSDYSGLAIFGILFVLFLNWLDRRLVRRKHFQQ